MPGSCEGSRRAASLGHKVQLSASESCCSKSRRPQRDAHRTSLAVANPAAKWPASAKCGPPRSSASQLLDVDGAGQSAAHDEPAGLAGLLAPLSRSLDHLGGSASRGAQFGGHSPGRVAAEAKVVARHGRAKASKAVRQRSRYRSRAPSRTWWLPAILAEVIFLVAPLMDTFGGSTRTTRQAVARRFVLGMEKMGPTSDQGHQLFKMVDRPAARSSCRSCSPCATRRRERASASRATTRRRGRRRHAAADAAQPRARFRAADAAAARAATPRTPRSAPATPPPTPRGRPGCRAAERPHQGGREGDRFPHQPDVHRGRGAGGDGAARGDQGPGGGATTRQCKRRRRPRAVPLFLDQMWAALDGVGSAGAARRGRAQGSGYFGPSEWPRHSSASRPAPRPSAC